MARRTNGSSRRTNWCCSEAMSDLSSLSMSKPFFLVRMLTLAPVAFSHSGMRS